MGIRAYWVLVLAVMLGTQFWIAEQFEWVGRGKARAVKAALGGSFHQLKLRPSYWVDLDGGRAGREGDLRWVLDIRGRPLLAPSDGALIALVGNKAWEDIDAKHLAALPYSATSFPAGYQDSPVRRGTVLAVRTAQGRLAKFRYVYMEKRWVLAAQWVVYPAVGEPEPSAWLEWLRMRDEARSAYRARDYAGVIAACRSGIAAARQTGATGPVHAQALIDCGGFLELNRAAPSQVETWLLLGTQIATDLGSERIVGVLGAAGTELRARGLRSLGLLYREQRRADESASYFRAEEEARSAPKAGR